MEQRLADQVAIITGAGSGLGAAIAKGLAAEGARCVLTGRRLERLQAVGAEIKSAGGVAHALVADLSDENQIEHLAQETARIFGGIDLLVNNAGIFRLTPFVETSTELLDQMLALNLRGAFLLCRAVWPHFLRRGGGQIVNLSSAAGVEGYPDSAAYSVTKFGLNGLSEALALEGKPHNIRVFAVCPGAVETPIWEGQAPASVRSRMMKPEAVAELVRWLVTSPRQLDFDPVVVRNFQDPWKESGDV
jgi:NAD(P)-dependent dehydrogenase (short-subunit alcohol dehydrogenase family)